MIITNSMAYFLYDIISMGYYGILGTDMLIHHFACIMGIYISIYEGLAASDIIGGIFIAEISNPAMHVRNILRNAGLRYTKLYEVFEYAFFCFYFFGRCIIGTPIVYKTLSCPQSNLVVRFVCGVITL